MSIIERLSEVRKQMVSESRRQKRLQRKREKEHVAFLADVRNKTEKLAAEVSEQVDLDNVLQELSGHLLKEGYQVSTTTKFEFVAFQDGSGIDCGRLRWIFNWSKGNVRNLFEIEVESGALFPYLRVWGGDGGRFSLSSGVKNVDGESFKNTVLRAFLKPIQKIY